ncbi:MAG: GNAT family N-acetyltransferase [Chitinophagaceae bacterium]|nr:GNAT family N-acetyltransferase [Chitinophagaceae bacterium]
MIRKCDDKDFRQIWEIINDGASAYKGIIPPDRWHDPYMSEEELKSQVDEGVQFWGYHEKDEMIGVMGIQDKGEVTLIRHAYVRSAHRNKGIGGMLLSHLTSGAITPILIGTWADATWAIKFYQKHGFREVSETEKTRLLMKYWNIPRRQLETSVVLAGQTTFNV